MTELSYPTAAPPPSPTTDATAVFGRRCLAWVIDAVIFFGLLIALFSSMSEYVDIPAGFDTGVVCETLQLQDSDAASGCFVIDDRAYITSEDDNALQTGAAVGYFAVFVLLQGLVGASPGKLVTGLRVVTADGTRAGVGRSLVRTLLWVVDGAPWFAPAVGFITGLTTTGHRRVGDMAAATYVVRRSSMGAPIATGVAVGGPAGAQAWGAPTQTDSWDTTSPQWPAQSAPPTAASWTPPTAAPPTAGPPPAAPPAAAPPAPDPQPAPGTQPDPEPRTDVPPPQWDTARNTYIQWDPDQQAWLQWDAMANRWKPIDT